MIETTDITGNAKVITNTRCPMCGYVKEEDGSWHTPTDQELSAHLSMQEEICEACAFDNHN